MIKKENKKSITTNQLNRGYNKIQEMDKSGKLVKDMPCPIWIDDVELEFKFFKDIGRKGAWIFTSDIQVNSYVDEVVNSDDL